LILEQILSWQNLHEAFDRVEENQGCAGIDGQTIAEFASGLDGRLNRLREDILNRAYRPLPLLRVYAEKSSGTGKRPLSIPTVRDRVAQTAAALVLTPILDPQFEEVSFAYREGRSVDQAIGHILSLRDKGYRWVVDADITSYFDEVPHAPLLQVLSQYVDDVRVQDLVRLWLSAEIQDGDLRFKPQKGVPQGSPLSPLLANLYLDRFDEECLRHRCRLVRFADDFVILCKSRPEAEKALELSGQALADLRLQLNPRKTRITTFEQGFRYLGVQFLRSLAFKPLFPEQAPEALVENAGTEPVDSPATADSAAPAKPSPETATTPCVSERAPVAPVPPPTQETLVGAALRKALAAPVVLLKRSRRSEFETDQDCSQPPSGHDPILRTLYLMEQGAELLKEDERLVVKKDGATLREVPALKVDQVMIFGNIRITTPAMQFCLLQNIPVFLLSSRGRYYGVIESTATAKVMLHRDQFARAGDPDFALALARAFVRGKVANCRTLLLRSARRTANRTVEEAAGRLEESLTGLDHAQTMDELRGMEGAAAARYFAAWPELVGPSWSFEGRKRRPPPDPVNSLLSFGYTLLFYNIYSLALSRGLHPYVGFFHAVRAGHPALVSDLQEEFRAPVVDSTVLSLLHKNQVKPDDFQMPGEPSMPCLLTDEARKKVTRAFEQALNRPVTHPDAQGTCDYRRAIALQAERLVEVIGGAWKSYEPFLIR
jgi:CRISPR-associated protein Cas1